MTHSITSKYNYGCYLNIQKKLNFYALQQRTKAGQPKRELRAFAFCQKTKKNQNKEEKIIVFCWLSTSLVKGFSFFFIHGGKNSLLFLQRNALWWFWRLKNSRKKKKSRKCLSLSFYLVFRHSHIFKDWKKHINRKKYFLSRKSVVFAF